MVVGVWPFVTTDSFPHPKSRLAVVAPGDFQRCAVGALARELTQGTKDFRLIPSAEVVQTLQMPPATSEGVWSGEMTHNSHITPTHQVSQDFLYMDLIFYVEHASIWVSY